VFDGRCAHEQLRSGYSPPARYYLQHIFEGPEKIPQIMIERPRNAQLMLVLVIGHS